MLTQAETSLVIFDCDGVLIDSEILSATTLVDLLEPLGVSLSFEHIHQHFLGRSFPTVSTAIRNDFNLDLPDDFESEYRRVLLKRFETQLKPTKGVVRVIEQLVTNSAVATSSSPERVARSLQITGLGTFFGTRVYTASEVSRGKPAPDLFLHVADKEGVEPSRCLVIEDSAPGVEAALSAGMNVLRYVGGSHFAGAQDPGSLDEKRAPVFDSWAEFFDIMPGLKKSSAEKSSW